MRTLKMAALSCLLLTTLTACERKPGDLDKWVGSKGGEEKLLGWMKSAEEPMPVRTHAVELLMGMNKASKLQQIFESMEKGDERDALVKAALPTIHTLWAAGDMPKIDMEQAKRTGGQAQVQGGNKSIEAKDAAYYLYPYASPDEQAKLQGIMATWLEKDHEIRDQLGATTLGQLLPRSGQKGFDGMMTWFKESKQNKNVIARKIREHGDDATKAKFAKVIVETANKAHPKLDDQLRVVVLETKNPVILPYLKRAIEDEASPGPLVDDAIDNYVRIQKEKATIYFATLIKKQKGARRWNIFGRMIELRGASGIEQAARALPLEIEAYQAEADQDGSFKKELNYICNFVKTELVAKGEKDPKKLGVKLEGIFGRLIDNSRWPSQVIGMKCAAHHKFSALKPKVEALTSNKEAIAGFGDIGTLGQLAADTLKGL